MTYITVKDFYREQKDNFELQFISGQDGADLRKISVPDINRPGLAISGFLDYFAHERVQVLGLTELSYLKKMTPVQKEKIFKKLLSFKVPCFIISRRLACPKELLNESVKRGVPVLSTKMMTTKLVSELLLYLEDKLAPQSTMHGVLVDIYGIGVLILGKSGLGKSECALELVSHGHRLIADDVVEIKRTTEKTLIGSGSEIIKHHMEIRGLGIIDVKNLFGVRAVRDRIRIELVVQLEEWDDSKDYDRLGLDEEGYEILGTNISKIVLPLRPGRSSAVFLEVAAMNQRLKKMGHHTAREFNQRIQERMINKASESIKKDPER